MSHFQRSDMLFCFWLERVFQLYTFLHKAWYCSFDSSGNHTWLVSTSFISSVTDSSPSFPPPRETYTGRAHSLLQPSLTEPALLQFFDMADAFNREAFTLLGVGTAIVALRTYARISMVGFRRLMLDDYLMILALVGSSYVSSVEDS